MDATVNAEGMQAVLDRLTRQEERGAARDATLAEMKLLLKQLNERLDTVAGDVRDAKTALRVGFWISTTIIPAGAAITGWIAAHLWPGR